MSGARLGGPAQGRDINLDILRVVGYRHWCNKLWNAVRFAMLNLGGGFAPAADFSPAGAPLGGRWVLSRASAAAAATNAAMEKYDFSAATTAVYAFWQYELCDVYIEVMKPIMSNAASPPEAKRATQARRPPRRTPRSDVSQCRLAPPEYPRYRRGYGNRRRRCTGRWRRACGCCTRSCRS